MQQKRIAAIVGPTACGKTALSIEAAHMLDAEIISADSVQLYRGMDIGSAKPDARERQGVPHHMIDVEDPLDGGLSVAQYQALALACVEDVIARGKLPLIVGGTGLYLNALTTPMDFAQAGSDEAFRAHWIDAEARDPGCAHRALAAGDPESAARLHPNDVKRVVRALEVRHLSGKTLSEANAENKAKQPLYPVTVAGLTMPRDMLHKRIERRAALMREQGLVEEVQALLDRGCDPASPAMQGLGYKEIAAAILRTPGGGIERDAALDEAFERITVGTRQYAKRQWTWFRRDARVRWFDMTDWENTHDAALAVVEYIRKECEA